MSCKNILLIAGTFSCGGSVSETYEQIRLIKEIVDKSPVPVTIAQGIENTKTIAESMNEAAHALNGCVETCNSPISKSSVNPHDRKYIKRRFR